MKSCMLHSDAVNHSLAIGLHGQSGNVDVDFGSAGCVIAGIGL